MRAVGGDPRLRAGRLREHDVARVVHEPLDRVGGGRGKREQGDERERALPARVIPPSAARNQPTPVVTASAIQITALERHHAQ